MAPHARRVACRVTIEMLFDFGGDARAPDIAAIGASQVNRCERRRVQPFVPALAIEIAGERDPFQSQFAKAELYIRCGTREVWLISIDPPEVFRITPGKREWLGASDEIQTPFLPGFSFRLEEFVLPATRVPRV